MQTGRRFVSCSHILQQNDAKRPLFIAYVCDSYFCMCALCLIFCALLIFVLSLVLRNLWFSRFSLRPFLCLSLSLFLVGDSFYPRFGVLNLIASHDMHANEAWPQK